MDHSGHRCAAAEAEHRGLHRTSDGLDVDGWALERSQLELVNEAAEDLADLQILADRCTRGDNQSRLKKALQEFQLRLRERRTWAWFPLTCFQWSGFEYGEPALQLSFKVPGAAMLAAEHIHCDFGSDWFDLRVWNVEWPEDPGVMYHHRVRKTRLMRDIVPDQCKVMVERDRVRLRLQKVHEPRHGYCAWPDLTAGKGRKPFRYLEDAPDGGLMDFLEGEYERHEGYDGFRYDIGKAMEQVHRGEPIRGIPAGDEEG